MQVEITRFETIDSTNRWAKENLTDLKPDTLYIVRSEEQTAGYGRRGHKWTAPKGKNLLLTLAFKLSNQLPTLLTHELCLCLATTLSQFSIETEIKWPNDLLLNRKKLAGALCEIKDGNAYLGVGLNVNTTQEELASIPQPATSLLIEKGHEFDLNELEKKLIANYLHKPPFSKNEYEKRLNREKIPYSGTCIGIDEQGALLIKTNNKTIKFYSFDD